MSEGKHARCRFHALDAPGGQCPECGCLACGNSHADRCCEVCGGTCNLLHGCGPGCRAEEKRAGGPEHTPGPWCVEKFDRTTHHVHERIGIVANNMGGRTLAKLPESYGGDYYTPEANARLIAAAPELLAALRHMLAYHDDLESDPGMGAARAALAKAEGREP